MNKQTRKLLINSKKTHFTSVIILLYALINSCNTNTNNQNRSKIVVRISSNPDGINPVFSTSSLAMYIGDNLYQKLLNYDYETGNLVPVLAQELPTVTNCDSFLIVEYTLRPESQWDNNKKITPSDVLFSFKLLALLKNSSESASFSTHQIKDIIIDEDNPRTISFKTVKSIRHLNFTGSDIVILPEFQLDPKQLFKSYSFSEIINKADSLRTSPSFDDLISSVRNKKWNINGGISGSGPYWIESWTPNKGLVLEKKKNWWGNKLKNTNLFFTADAPRIEFRIIKEEAAALAQLKNKEIDAMFYINPLEFKSLKTSKSFINDFHLFNPDLLIYSYVGVNTQNPILKDKNTRKALACLINTEHIIKNIRMGYAQQINGPLPINNFTNPTINHYPYDLELAKSFLKKAGWTDSNNNGILDMVIDGKFYEFKIDYKFSSNDMRKAVGEMLRQEGEKIGLKITPEELPFQDFIVDLRNHNFDLCYDAISTDLSPVNVFDLYHTTSINNGHNYFFFGNKTSDNLIEKMDATLDSNEYKKLYFELQEILHDEAAHIFLICSQNPLAVRRDMGKVPTFSNYPGFWIAALNPLKNNTP